MIKEFQISEDRLKLFGEELLMWGQQHRLQPFELAIVMKMLHEWLAKEIGLSQMEVTKAETP